MSCDHCSRPFAAWGCEGTTLLGCGSPPGHSHDENCRTRRYVCTDDHVTVVSIRQRCPACDWIGPKSCFCHKGDKVDKWPEAPFDKTINFFGPQKSEGPAV